MKKIITSPAAPPAGSTPISHGVEANGLLFTSGQINLDKEMKLVGSTTTEQTRQAMSNLGSILEAADLTFANVIKATIYITNMEIYSELNEVYSSYFDGDFPAREVVCVRALPLGAPLEISMVAAR